MVFFENNTQDHAVDNIGYRATNTMIRRLGRGGGRPPDNRNAMFLLGKKVVKKIGSRNGLTRISSNIPCDLFKGSVGDGGEPSDNLNEDANVCADEDGDNVLPIYYY